VAIAALIAGCDDTGISQLSVELAATPVARRVTVPGVPDAVLWNVEYAIEIAETECVDVTLSFVHVDIFEEGLQVQFGGPDEYGTDALRAQEADQLVGCGEPVVVRGFMGSIGAPRPIGPVRVRVRAVGVDENGHGVGAEEVLRSDLTVAP
jgi:hypothetical protein